MRANRLSGFGATIMVINGGIECRDCTLTPPAKKQWAALTWRHSMPRAAPSAPFTGLPLVRTVGWPPGKLRTAPLSRATTQGANMTCRTRVDLYTNYRHLIL